MSVNYNRHFYYVHEQADKHLLYFISFLICGFLICTHFSKHRKAYKQKTNKVKKTTNCAILTAPLPSLSLSGHILMVCPLFVNVPGCVSVCRLSITALLRGSAPYGHAYGTQHHQLMLLQLWFSTSAVCLLPVVSALSSSPRVCRVSLFAHLGIECQVDSLQFDNSKVVSRTRRRRVSWRLRMIGGCLLIRDDAETTSMWINELCVLHTRTHTNTSVYLGFGCLGKVIP